MTERYRARRDIHIKKKKLVPRILACVGYGVCTIGIFALHVFAITYFACPSSGKTILPEFAHPLVPRASRFTVVGITPS